MGFFFRKLIDYPHNKAKQMSRRKRSLRRFSICRTCILSIRAGITEWNLPPRKIADKNTEISYEALYYVICS
jgi:hypothetical protein